jgi:hypothetical protein
VSLWDIHCVEPWDGEEGDYVWVWEGGPIEAESEAEAMKIFHRDHGDVYDRTDGAWAKPAVCRVPAPDGLRGCDLPLGHDGAHRSGRAYGRQLSWQADASTRTGEPDA